jgi:hypothetical protein
LHFCDTNAETEFESAAQEERVRRFWTLWTNGQGGRVGTFGRTLDACFRRFNAGEASGQTTYQLSRDTKAEMLRVPLQPAAVLPASLETPGPYFLRDDDMPISHAPPTNTKGISWVGIRWSAPSCDLDLYTRGDPSSPWLYYGNGKSAEGYFNKDWQTATADGQLEYVEYTREIDILKAEVAVNLYACDASAPPEGVARIWFSGKVYEAPFKLAARSGNKGAPPISPPYRVRIDLRKVVGLAKE